jgi:hypothetical protein
MGGVVKTVGGYLGFGGTPGSGQQMGQQGFDQYAQQRATYEPKFQGAVEQLGERSAGGGQTQGFLDTYLNSEYAKAQAQQAAIAASNTTRNQAAAQRDAARNVAALGADQAAQGAAMKYKDITDAQQQYTNALMGRIQSFEGNQQSAQATGVRSGEAADAERQRGFDRLGGIAKGASGLIMSDKNAKKNIKPGNKQVESFLDALQAYEYDYKEGKGPKGKKVSAMAQDIEKSDIGKQMVKETKEGKKVDYNQGFAAMLAGMANLNERLREMEEKKNG